MAAIKDIKVGRHKSYNLKTFLGEIDPTVKSKVGRWTTQQGKSYSGETKLSQADIQQQGVGVCSYPDHAVAAGMFNSGDRSKYCTTVTAGGTVYLGEWSNDERSGVGVQLSGDGDLYSGEWRHDVPSGHGILDRFETEGDEALLEVGMWLPSSTESMGVPELKAERSADNRNRSIEKAHKQQEQVKLAVRKSLEQIQAGIRAQMRGDDAELRAQVQIDIEGDDGTQDAVKIENARAESAAAGALKQAKKAAKKKVALEMADMHSKLQSIEARIEYSLSVSTNYQYWLDLTHKADARVRDLSQELKRLKKLERMHRMHLV